MAGIADKYDFTVDQGATFNVNLIWKDEAGNIIDLSGYTSRMQVRSNYNSDVVLLSLTTENGRIILTNAEGKITLNVDAVTMADIDYGQFVYDIEMISSGNIVTRLLMGNFTVRPEVTR